MANHIYIHIPFCIKKCGYCSFYSVVYDEDLVEKYVDVLCVEIETSHLPPKIPPYPPLEKGGGCFIETIYFGGGTPSLLKPFEIEKILNNFDLSDIKEITLEVNPATVSFQALKEYRDIGINRLSIGTQSMKDSELEFLGRIHRVQDVISLYENGLPEIFDNVSHDYIYGLPHQKLSDVEYSIKELLKLKPSHISIYNLSLEENVPLYKHISQLPDDELVSDMYFLIREMMLSSGYVQYELSSFCMPSKESLHNLSYWSSVDYIGIGAGACGYVDGFRYENGGLEVYMAMGTSRLRFEGGNGIIGDWKSPLRVKSDTEKEYIITGLRKTAGISLADYEKRFGCSFMEKYSNIIKKMLEKGFIEVDSNVRLCPEYYFISNEVLCEFV